MLSLIEVRRWARADFPVTAEGVVRLSPELARIVSSRALATKRDAERVCAWMVAAIEKAGGAERRAMERGRAGADTRAIPGAEAMPDAGAMAEAGAKAGTMERADAMPGVRAMPGAMAGSQDVAGRAYRSTGKRAAGAMLQAAE